MVEVSVNNLPLTSTRRLIVFQQFVDAGIVKKGRRYGQRLSLKTDSAGTSEETAWR